MAYQSITDHHSQRPPVHDVEPETLDKALKLPHSRALLAELSPSAKLPTAATAPSTP